MHFCIEGRMLETRPQLETHFAKPGVRWTHYGMWTDDCLSVINQHGRVVYSALDGIRRTTRPPAKPALYLVQKSSTAPTSP